MRLDLLQKGRLKDLCNPNSEGFIPFFISTGLKYRIFYLNLPLESNEERKMKNGDLKHINLCVVGLGYVGLPLAVEKAKAGFKTIGFDVQKEKVEMVNSGHNYIGDVVDSDLKKLVDKVNNEDTGGLSLWRK